MVVSRIPAVVVMLVRGYVCIAIFTGFPFACYHAPLYKVSALSCYSLWVTQQPTFQLPSSLTGFHGYDRALFVRDVRNQFGFYYCLVLVVQSIRIMAACSTKDTSQLHVYEYIYIYVYVID